MFPTTNMSIFLLLDITALFIFLFGHKNYHMVGKFGESSLIRQTKTIQICTYN